MSSPGMETETLHESLIASDMMMTLNAAGVGMWMLDADSGEFSLDGSCRRLFDLDRDETLAPELLLRKLPAEDLENYRQAIRHAMETGVFECDYRIRLRDGRMRHISGRGRILPRTDRRLIIKGVCIDVSRSHELEAELAEKSRELARSNRDLEQFAYVASHDLKAPLRAIDLLVDWLREDLADHAAGEVQNHLQLLKQRSSRLHRLLDDLLTYSRAGRQRDQICPVDSAELARDIVSLLAPPATMQLTIDAWMPRLSTCRAALEQVLRNLINNAIKHHPTGEGHIRISAEDRPDEVLFAVEDDGGGIAPQYADKVFQMFQTLRPRDEVEGSGMGLAIVKRIVEQQGGRIWFEPAPGGRGTVFRFSWKKLPDAPPVASSEVPHEHEHGQDRQYLAG